MEATAVQGVAVVRGGRANTPLALRNQGEIEKRGLGRKGRYGEKGPFGGLKTLPFGAKGKGRRGGKRGIRDLLFLTKNAHQERENETGVDKARGGQFKGKR